MTMVMVVIVVGEIVVWVLLRVKIKIIKKIHYLKSMMLSKG